MLQLIKFGFAMRYFHEFDLQAKIVRYPTHEWKDSHLAHSVPSSRYMLLEVHTVQVLGSNEIRKQSCLQH